MTEAELRALVRDAVARHLGRSAPTPVTRSVAAPPSLHPSHAMYLTLVNTGEACVIEPNVECTHCGYCKTHGH